MKNINHIKKIANKLVIQILSFIVIWLGFIIFVTAYPSTPNWETMGWKIINVLNWILQSWDYKNSLTDWVYKLKSAVNSDGWYNLIWNNHSCNSWEWLQWFDSNWNKVCVAVSPKLCWWWHTEKDCTNAWWEVVSAWGTCNLCNFVPWVWWHTCTDLNCNTKYNPPSYIKDYHFAAHPRYWSCPSWWSRYNNWWEYGYNWCWVTQEGWLMYNTEWDTCYYWTFSTVCLLWQPPSSCWPWGFATGPSGLKFVWWPNNNHDGYYYEVPRYGWAMCPDWTNQHFGFANMNKIWCN